MKRFKRKFSQIIFGTFLTVMVLLSALPVFADDYSLDDEYELAKYAAYYEGFDDMKLSFYEQFSEDMSLEEFSKIKINGVWNNYFSTRCFFSLIDSKACDTYIKTFSKPEVQMVELPEGDKMSQVVYDEEYLAFLEKAKTDFLYEYFGVSKSKDTKYVYIPASGNYNGMAYVGYYCQNGAVNISVNSINKDKMIGNIEKDCIALPGHEDSGLAITFYPQANLNVPGISEANKSLFESACELFIDEFMNNCDFRFDATVVCDGITYHSNGAPAVIVPHKAGQSHSISVTEFKINGIDASEMIFDTTNGHTPVVFTDCNFYNEQNAVVNISLSPLTWAYRYRDLCENAFRESQIEKLNVFADEEGNLNIYDSDESEIFDLDELVTELQEETVINTPGQTETEWVPQVIKPSTTVIKEKKSTVWVKTAIPIFAGIALGLIAFIWIKKRG